MHSIQQLPTMIRNTASHALAAKREIFKVELELDSLIADIETSIAFDSELKNDAQRKAKRLGLLQSQAVVELQQNLEWKRANLTATEIELEMLRNQLSIAKLEARERIARLEIQNV